MLIPIPNRVDDPKEAVLWSILSKLQEIDENAGTRMAFATNVAYNQHVGLNLPIFEFELAQIRDILKVQKPAEDINEANSTSRSFEEPTPDLTMRDDV